MRLRSVVQIGVAVLGGMVLLALVGFTFGPGAAAAPARPPAKDSPTISVTSVTALNLLVATRQVGAQQIVYFDNSMAGTLSLTLAVSGTAPLALGAEPVFDTSHAVTSAIAPWTPVLTYAVLPSHATQLSVRYQVTDSLDATADLVLDYVRDVEAPDVQVGMPPVVETSPFVYVPAGALQIYYGAVTTTVPFTIEGTATDAGIGLDEVIATPALSTTAPVNAGTAADWAFEYTIAPGMTATGQITVSALDLLGHVTPVTLTYTHDAEGPAVLVTATRLTSDSVQLAWSAQDAGAGVDVYDVRVNGSDVLTATMVTSRTLGDLPDTQYHTFVVTAIDRVGNRGSGTASLGKLRVYLPMVMRSYLTLANGGFDDGLDAWTPSAGGFTWGAETYGDVGLSVTAASSSSDDAAALLGSPAYANASIPVGYGQITQTFFVQHDKLRIAYEMVSYDIIQGGGDLYFDTFEVVLDDTPLDGASPVITDGQRGLVRAATPAFDVDGKIAITVTNPGLVLIDGRDGHSDDAGTKWESGLRSVTLDLSKYRDQMITLGFTIWSREYEPSAREDAAWYNTYVYLEDVQYVP